MGVAVFGLGVAVIGMLVMGFVAAIAWKIIKFLFRIIRDIIAH